jgi:thymidine kinase
MYADTLPSMPLTLILGPMFAGKTRTLIERVAAAGESAIAAKSRTDTRFGPSVIASHDGARLSAVTVSSPADLVELAREASLVGFDEAQFLPVELVVTLCDLASERPVVVGALDLDFRGRRFPSTPLLEDAATTIVRLTARCTRCGGVGTMTQRLVGGEPADLSDETVKVGGAELYAPRCPSCWFAERSLADLDRRVAQIDGSACVPTSAFRRSRT